MLRFFLFAAYVLISLRAYGVGSGYVLVSLRAYACAYRLFRRLGSIRLFGAGYFAAWAQYTGAAVLCARFTARIRTALRFAPPCPNRPT